MKLSIILPAYNEGDHIEEVVLNALNCREGIKSKTGFHDVEIVIVNDGSEDDTRSNVEKLLQQNHKSFVLRNHEENQGYGAALKTGFDTASGDYLAFMDADGTIDPNSFIIMFAELQKTNADMALGIRFGGSDSKMPIVRKLGNYFFAALLSFLSGEKVRDTATGIRLFKKNILAKLYPLPDGLHFTPAMSSKAVHEKIKIVEVPISYSQRSGESKLHVLKDGFRFLRIILGTVLLYNPFKVFSFFGMLLILISMGLLVKPVMVFFSPRDLVFSDYIYRSISAMYLFVAGFQLILFGILARFLVSTFFRMYESGDVFHVINKKVRIYNRMAFYGLLAFVGGILINTIYLIQYLVEKDLRLHWAWLLLAAGMIITGLQMMISGLLIKVVRKIKQTIDYHS